jgi:hypothetical protein
MGSTRSCNKAQMVMVKYEKWIRKKRIKNLKTARG